MSMIDRRAGETKPMGKSAGASLRWLGLVVLCGGLLTGCVTSEKYEAEKARALNFQRLLAQEEKRSSELQDELQRAKRETSELEMRNRSLSSELDSLQGQVSRMQDETARLREQATQPMVEESIKDTQDLSLTLSDPMMSELESELENSSRMMRDEPALGGPSLSEPSMGASSRGGTSGRMGGGMSMEEPSMTTSAMGEPTYYTVKPGDTLFSLSRKYGVTVKQIKRWNNLDSNLIRVGERLIVGHQ